MPNHQKPTWNGTYSYISYDPLQEEIPFLHDRFQVHQHHSSCVCFSVNWVDLWSPNFKWDQKGTWQGNAQLLPRQTCRPRNREFWKLKARKMVKVQKSGSDGERVTSNKTLVKMMCVTICYPYICSTMYIVICQNEGTKKKTTNCHKLDQNWSHCVLPF